MLFICSIVVYDDKIDVFWLAAVLFSINTVNLSLIR